jgi:hypothetical protein
MIIVLFISIVLFVLCVSSLKWRFFGIGIDGSLWKKWDPLKKIKTGYVVLLIIISFLLAILYVYLAK